MKEVVFELATENNNLKTQPQDLARETAGLGKEDRGSRVPVQEESLHFPWNSYSTQRDLAGLRIKAWCAISFKTNWS